MIKKNAIKKVKYGGKIYELDSNNTKAFIQNVRNLGGQIFNHLEVPAHLRDYFCYLEMGILSHLSAKKFNIDGEEVADLIVRFYMDDEFGGTVESFVDFLRSNAQREWERHGVEWSSEQYQLYLEAAWIWAARTAHYENLDYATIFEIVQEISS